MNKDSKNEALEGMIKAERERRETEGTELRNLLLQEREKSLQAAREAQKYATEIETAKREADRAYSELENKKARVEEMESQLIQFKIEAKHEPKAAPVLDNTQHLEAKHQDEVNSLQLRLANRESEVSRMESLLIELHHSVDQANRDREAARMEKDSVVIQKITLEERIHTQ